MKSKLFFIFLFISITTTLLYGQLDSLIIESLKRTYIVHLPTGYNSGIQYPLVINMHGNGLDASNQESYSQMDVIADTAKFIVVYPNAYGNFWNSGCCTGNPAINDVGFISALIDTLENNFSINPNKIFACGLSGGGFMSHRLACELNYKIAAIASVAGLLADTVRLFSCPDNCAVPVMNIHGTTDLIINYNGSSENISADSTIKWWVARDGCLSTPVITNIPDNSTTDGCSVTKYYYGSGNDSSEVIFFKITNGGHTWPGGAPIWILGNTNQDINASQEIWNFFRKHSLKCGTSSVNESSIISNSLSVYPNPTSGTLTLSSSQPINNMQIKIYNSIGSLVKTVATKQTPVVIDVSELSLGLYTVHLDNIPPRTLKFIKQ